MKENKIEKLILDLSNRWECTPQEAVDRLNSMNESEINKLIKSMIKKFQSGGSLTRKNSEIIVGDSPDLGGTWEEYIEYNSPKGTVRKMGNEYSSDYGIGKNFPGLSFGPAKWQFKVQDAKYKLQHADEWLKQRRDARRAGNEVPNWKDLLNGEVVMRNGGIIDCLRKGGSIPECKCGKTIGVKKAALGTEIGGKISKVARSTMFDDAAEFMPEADRKFVRQAYRTAKNHGRDLGLTGRGLRNWAKGQVSDRFREYADNSPVNSPVNKSTPMPKIPLLSTDIEIEDEPIVINDKPFTNLDASVPTVQKIDRFGGNFNSAFAAAKRNGLDKFYWTDPTGKNSGWKTTELGKSTPTQGAVEATSTPAVVREATIPENVSTMVAYPSSRSAYVGSPMYNDWVYKPSVEYGYPYNPSFVNENSSISNATSNVSQPVGEEVVAETPKRRTFLSQLWDPHPEALPTHDRYAANKQKTREFLDRYSPRARARK